MRHTLAITMVACPLVAWISTEIFAAPSRADEETVSDADFPSLEINEAVYRPFLPSTSPSTVDPTLVSLVSYDGVVYDNSAANGEVACQSCSTGSRYPYDRCGCNAQLFPWTPGPGRCDNWCVGPKWAVAVDGMILFRDDADWDRIVTAVGTAPSHIDQFDPGPGARIFATGYNASGFGIQVGYEGVNTWNATALFPSAGSVRSFDYETTLNSLEINFFPRVPYPLKFFSGFRYIEIDEDFRDFTSNDKPIPAPADPPAASVAIVDMGSDFLNKNRLIGFQLGARRDTWQFSEWLTIESFANAGVYYNKFRRIDVASTVTTVITGDDLATPDTNEFSQQTTEVRSAVRRNYNDMAFLGEAGITGVARLNQCVALRVGYQAMVADGVGQGLDAFFGSGLQSSTIFYHGLQFGAEYRR